MAEALASICRAYNSQSINQGRSTPHIVVHLSLHDWLGTRIGRIDTTTGGRVSRETMQRLACEAVIWFVTEGGEREQLDLFRTARTFSVAQRRLLEARDGGCRFPGCCRPAALTEAHHHEWWSVGGPTNVDNAMLLCRFHHKLVHEGRWRVEKQGASFVWYRPRGELYGTSPPPPSRV